MGHIKADGARRDAIENHTDAGRNICMMTVGRVAVAGGQRPMRPAIDKPAGLGRKTVSTARA
jgi:hypothetical protein